MGVAKKGSPNGDFFPPRVNFWAPGRFIFMNLKEIVSSVFYNDISFIFRVLWPCEYHRLHINFSNNLLSPVNI
jgi:hypothetical protein